MHKYPVILTSSRSPRATEVSEHTLSQDKARFSATDTLSTSSPWLSTCWTVWDGVTGVGGGVIQTGKDDCEARVAILTEETGRGIGEIDVLSMASSLPRRRHLLQTTHSCWLIRSPVLFLGWRGLLRCCRWRRRWWNRSWSEGLRRYRIVFLVAVPFTRKACSGECYFEVSVDRVETSETTGWV